MSPSTLRKAIWVVKDRATIGLAKVRGGASSLKVAVVNATRHDEHPTDEHRVLHILTLASQCHVHSCVAAVARRLRRTRNWAVALKSLVLVRRLLAGGGRAFEHEIFFAPRRGTRFFNMYDFRDGSGRLEALDCSAFVRAYAMYMDERLEFRMRGHRGCYAYRGDVEHLSTAPVREMKNEKVFERAQHLRQLMQKCLGCIPSGAAKHNRLVVVSVYPILKESFQLYYDLTEVTATLVDRFMQLEVSDMVKVHEIFKWVSKQFDELDKFYEWAKAVRIVRASECPQVEKIPQAKLDTMEEFIHQKSLMKMKQAHKEPEHETKKVDLEDLLLIPVEGSTIEEAKNEGGVEEDKKEVVELMDLMSGDLPTSPDEQADKWALALFGDDYKPESTAAGGDWETALVLSVGSFDESMYQEGGVKEDFSGVENAGSIVLYSEDPFGAPVGVSAPVNVQTSEMERRQKLLEEEQVMWREYGRCGMGGQGGVMNVQHGNSYQYATW